LCRSAVDIFGFEHAGVDFRLVCRPERGDLVGGLPPNC